jgi:ribosomal protein S18 acetylase RimI-like enzyme
MSSPAPLTAAHADAATRALAAAFADNPVFVHALRGVDKPGREAKLRRLFKSFVRTNLQRGTASAILDGDQPAAISLAYGPGSYPLGLGGWISNGLGAATLGLGHTIRLARLDGAIAGEHFKEPHWYLFVLGVHPSQQGRGLGGTLVKAHLERAAADGVPAYLETDREDNVRFYGRFGYEVVKQLTLAPLGNLQMWLMLKR